MKMAHARRITLNYSTTKRWKLGDYPKIEYLFCTLHVLYPLSLTRKWPNQTLRKKTLIAYRFSNQSTLQCWLNLLDSHYTKGSLYNNIMYSFENIQKCVESMSNFIFKKIMAVTLKMYSNANLVGCSKYSRQPSGTCTSLIGPRSHPNRLKLIVLFKIFAKNNETQVINQLRSRWMKTSSLNLKLVDYQPMRKWAVMQFSCQKPFRIRRPFQDSLHNQFDCIAPDNMADYVANPVFYLNIYIFKLDPLFSLNPLSTLLHKSHSLSPIRSGTSFCQSFLQNIPSLIIASDVII